MGRRRPRYDYSCWDRPRGQSDRSCRRKVGSLAATDDDPHTRTVRGAVAVADFQERLRAVYSACSPQRGFVQLAVHDYMDRWRRHGSYGLYVKDTNALLAPKEAREYKRPGHLLCPVGHVPVTWLYDSTAAVAGRNLFGFLTIATYRAARRELRELAGRDVTDIEVVVQPIFLPPNPRVEQAMREREEERQRERERWDALPRGPVGRAFRKARGRDDDSAPAPSLPVSPPPKWPDRYIMTWGLVGAA